MAGRRRVAVLVSGRGSNLQALIDAAKAPDYPAEIICVISNRPQAYALRRADEAGLEPLVLDHKAFADRDQFEEALQAALKERRIDLVCLAGFMRLLNAEFVAKWRDRMLNIHPSLLPAFKGLHTHERVLEEGVRFTGATVHFVRPEMDSGPIIAQSVVAVHPGDTKEDLAVRVLAQEHLLYAEALRLVASGAVRVRGDKVIVTGAGAPDQALINPVIAPHSPPRATPDR
ncbi:MAG: phosphoribosylglycinamide formyltransferase [Rhodothalassiaceae bacterium]